MKSFKVFLLIAVSMAGGMLGAGLMNRMNPNSSMAMNSQPPIRNVSLLNTAPPADFTTAAELSVTAVVHVKTLTNRSAQMGGQFFDPFQFFWGQPTPQQAPQQQSAGSGVIISDDGYIVTNNHVIDQADEVSVTLDNKQSYTAKVIGTDPSTDLALLKVEGKGLPFMRWGNSDQVKVGEWVLAVGNPFNLTSTVTAGIVSAKARNINILPSQRFPIESFIQTDAAVNPGNSGGALVNAGGDLIGINTAIASTTGSYAGYSFAVPVNIVRKVVMDLMEFGTVQRGFIGVSIRDLDADFAKEKSISSLNGVYVNGLTESGAAASAGIKEGDVIVSINGSAIKSSPELQEQVGRYRPGDEIAVTIIRGGMEKTLSVTLRNRDGETRIRRNEAAQVLGATLETAKDSEISRLGIQHGVKVKELNSGKLKSAGLREGFIITSIDNKAVKSPQEVLAYLESREGGVLIEGIYPNGLKAFYGFGM